MARAAEKDAPCRVARRRSLVREGDAALRRETDVGALLILRNRVVRSETSERLGYKAGAGLNFGIDPGHDLRIAGAFHAVQPDSKHWEGFYTVGVSLRSKVAGPR